MSVRLVPHPGGPQQVIPYNNIELNNIRFALLVLFCSFFCSHSQRKGRRGSQWTSGSAHRRADCGHSNSVGRDCDRFGVEPSQENASDVNQYVDIQKTLWRHHQHERHFHELVTAQQQQQCEHQQQRERRQPAHYRKPVTDLRTNAQREFHVRRLRQVATRHLRDAIVGPQGL